MFVFIYFEKDVTPQNVAYQLSFHDSYFVLFIAEKKKSITYISDTLHMLPHCQLNHPAEIPDESAPEGQVTGSSRT